MGAAQAWHQHVADVVQLPAFDGAGGNGGVAVGRGLVGALQEAVPIGQRIEHLADAAVGLRCGQFLQCGRQQPLLLHRPVHVACVQRVLADDGKRGGEHVVGRYAFPARALGGQGEIRDLDTPGTVQGHTQLDRGRTRRHVEPHLA
ncbi:hypothetical protein D3C72_1839160 [compost metagenome]